jgi:hypothetical protein
MSLREESTFLFASTDDIKSLSKEHSWMGPLDQQLAGKAYRAGAALAFRISGSCIEKHGNEYDQPYKHSPERINYSFTTILNQRDNPTK